jgi:hypothetical protein
MADETTDTGDQAIAFATTLFVAGLLAAILGTVLVAGWGPALIVGAVILLAAASWFMHVASTKVQR